MKATKSREPSPLVKVKKAYKEPRVDDLGDAIAKTKGSEGSIADGASGARQDRHYW